MSRAFVKEDVDPPERFGRPRTASGLPPGAANYMTERGASRLKAKLDELRESVREDARIAQLEQILASATIVGAPPDRQQIAFGARVTLRDAAGRLRAVEIVGVDELDLHPEGVSWISPIGKALLAAEVGDRVTLGVEERVIAVDYPNE